LTGVANSDNRAVRGRSEEFAVADCAGNGGAGRDVEAGTEGNPSVAQPACGVMGRKPTCRCACRREAGVGLGRTVTHCRHPGRAAGAGRSPHRLAARRAAARGTAGIARRFGRFCKSLTAAQGHKTVVWPDLTLITPPDKETSHGDHPADPVARPRKADPERRNLRPLFRPLYIIGTHRKSLALPCDPAPAGPDLAQSSC